MGHEVEEEGRRKNTEKAAVPQRGGSTASGPAGTEGGGLKSQPPGYRFSTSCYDIFQVIFVSEGELLFEDSDGLRGLGAGDLAVLKKGSRFSLSSPRSGYGGVFYVDLRGDRDVQNGTAAAFAASKPVNEIASIIQHYLFAGGAYSEIVITALCRSLAWAALRQSAEAENPKDNDPARYWTERISLAVQASLYGSNDEFRRRIGELQLSYKQLNRYCKQNSGCTVKELQIREKLREAERLLSGSSLSITDIAIELHFASSQKLAARFKEYYGRSPSEYRQRYRL